MKKFHKRKNSRSELEPSFNSIHLVKQLENTNFPIYLAYKDKTYYVLKIFPATETSTIHFLNEIKFKTLLSHPNILTIQDHGFSSELCNKSSQEVHCYYTLSPYCPNGSLFDMIVDKKIKLDDEKLIRTYFHQIVAAVEHMHKQKVAHLDLKLENILVDNDYQLKIIDFEGSYCKGDGHLLSFGTIDYRAPELYSGKIGHVDPFKADIYSLGILLFVLLHSSLPFFEDKEFRFYRREFERDPKQFWKLTKKETDIKRSGSFKTLFRGMVQADPKDRLTIDEIKGTEWFQGETYSGEELTEIMHNKYENSL